MNVVELTKKLISIPSYVDENNSEAKIGEYLYGFLKENCPWLKVTKQRVEAERFNIIARDDTDTKLMFANHLDTVEPREGSWAKPAVRGGRIYGLGAVDRKGGVASLLSALKEFKNTKGLMLLFYVAEEYDFKGMKKFVKNLKGSPELVVGCESNFEIANGCRGLIELELQVVGRSGHPARAKFNRNIIKNLVDVIGSLETDLKKYTSKTFGETTLNLAYLKGGLMTKSGTLSKQGNNIPNFAEAVIEIRPAVNEVTADEVIAFLKKALPNCQIKIRHDLKGYLTERGELTKLTKAIETSGFKVTYRDLKYRGYSDLAMINQKFKIAGANFGPKGGNKHKGDEYVEIKDLERCRKVYTNLIKQMCT